MAISLYDISVASYLQTLGGVAGFLDKGAAHCEANGIDLDEVVETRLFADMWPFRLQIVSVAHHSLGAIKALQAGVFRPPSTEAQLDYAGLQALVADARDELQKCTPDAVNALAGKELAFELGGRRMPFINEDFVLTFSLPNFYFHATTAYDILRMKGVPLGKRDFMGQLRMKS